MNNINIVKGFVVERKSIPENVLCKHFVDPSPLGEPARFINSRCGTCDRFKYP